MNERPGSIWEAEDVYDSMVRSRNAKKEDITSSGEREESQEFLAQCEVRSRYRIMMRSRKKGKLVQRHESKEVQK